MLGGMSGAPVINIVIKAVDKFSKTMGGITNTLQKHRAGFMAMAGVGVAISGGLGLAVKAASDFDAAMTESTAIMGNVSDKMKNKMEETARTIAKETTFSAKEAADSYFYLASAGLDAEESVKALGDMAQFAQAGQFDMARATDLLTDSASALNLEVEDYNRLSDVLVKANTLANASVEQFATALTRKAGAAMRNMNMEVEEGTAILATFADQGIKGENAGVIFTQTLTNMTEMSRKNKDEFEALGVSLFDTEGELKNMADIVSELEVGLEGMTTEERDATLAQLGFNSRAREGILAMLGNSEAIREYEDELRNAGGTTKKVADKQLESFEAQMSLLKSEITDVAIEIGNVLIPVLRNIIEAVSPVITKIMEWIKENPKLTKWIAILTGALGAILVVVGTLGVLIPILTAGFSALGVVLGVILSPIGLIILAILAIIAAGYLLWKHWDTVKEFFIMIWEKIKEVFSSAWEFIKGLFMKYHPVGMVIKHWQKISGFFSKLWDGVKEIFASAINFLIEKAESLANVWITAINAIIKGLNKLSVSVPDWVPMYGGRTWGVNIQEVPKVSLPRLAEGGIVTKPTTALIGEAGPEAIIPLNKGFAKNEININIENVYGTDPDEIANALQEKLSTVINY